MSNNTAKKIAPKVVRNGQTVDAFATQSVPTEVVSPDIAALQAQIAALQAQNAALKAAKAGGRLTIKVTRKGGVAVYGLGRFPCTLYAGQWENLFKLMGCANSETNAVEQFIKANEGKTIEGEDKDGKFTTRISRKEE